MESLRRRENDEPFCSPSPSVSKKTLCENAIVDLEIAEGETTRSKPSSSGSYPRRNDKRLILLLVALFAIYLFVVYFGFITNSFKTISSTFHHSSSTSSNDKDTSALSHDASTSAPIFNSDNRPPNDKVTWFKAMDEDETPQNQQYVSYRIDPREGFSNQRQRLENAIRIASVLGRTLVLSPISVTPHVARIGQMESEVPSEDLSTLNTGKKTWEAWRSFDSYFDLEHLRRSLSVPVILEREFKVERKKMLWIQADKNDAVWVDDCSSTWSEDHPCERIQKEVTEKALVNYNKKKAASSSFNATFNPPKVRDLTAEFGSLEQREIRFRDLQGSSLFVTASEASQHLVDLPHKALRYSPPLLKVATRIVQKLMSDEEAPQPGSFDCLHLRRGDFIAKYGDQTNDPAQVADKIKNTIIPEGNLLYLATDEQDSKALRPLQDAFRVRSLTGEYAKMATKAGVNKEHFLLLDQLVCSEARRFVQTANSTFSKTVQNIRLHQSRLLSEEVKADVGLETELDMYREPKKVQAVMMDLRTYTTS